MVYALAATSTGVYAGGDFTSAGESRSFGIAKWDRHQSIWYSLGRGTNSSVRAIVLAPDGSLFAGGMFSRAGGVSASFVAKWSPTEFRWEPLGRGVSNMVRSLAATPQGRILVAGVFTAADGRPSGRIASWEPSLSEWEGFETGTDGTVVTVLPIGHDGFLAGGHFTTAGGRASVHIAEWNASAYATGLTADARPDSDNELSIYPNPVTNQATIRLPTSGDARVLMFDLLGRRVMDTVASSGQMLSFAAFAPGIYIIRVVGDRPLRRTIVVGN